MKHLSLATIIILMAATSSLKSSEPLVITRARVCCLNHERVFHAFVERCSAKEMKKLIKHYQTTGKNLQERINARDHCGIAPIHRAAQLCKTSCLRLLIEQGADINAPDNGGWTPLHYAAATEERGTAKRDHIVEILCKAGANKNLLDRSLQNPREIAFSYGHGTTAQLMLLAGKTS